tara:strand:+ start:14787 stop:15242 length:456 start_codon:yes stop_codon:yes gene_type:complete
MQYSEGRIVSLSEHAATRSAVLDVEAVAACPRCAEGKGCGAGVVAGPGKRRRINASVADGLRLQPGDQVSFVLAPEKLLQAAMVVYGYPLLAGVLGALAAYLAGLGDAGTAVAAILGLGLGFAVARKTLTRQRCLRDFTPLVVDNLGAGLQ